MVVSKDRLGRDVRKVRERVRMSWGSKLSLHSVHKGLLKIYNKSQGYQSQGELREDGDGDYVQRFGHGLVPLR